MIKTVHEDDLTAWYGILDGVGDVSIGDLELEDEDLLSGDHSLVSSDSDDAVQILDCWRTTNWRKSRKDVSDVDSYFDIIVSEG